MAMENLASNTHLAMLISPQALLLDFMSSHWKNVVCWWEDYPLAMTNIAIENGPVEIADLPINSMVIFHS
jgi:hypothetical protein